MALRLRFSGRDDLVRTVRNSGTTSWFSPDTLQFFACRIGDTLYAGGRVFVTSERNPSGVRLYSVRLLCDSDNTYAVQTVGVFGAYTSRSGAHLAARRVARHLDQDQLYYTSAECDALAVAAGIPVTGGFNAV